MRTSTKTLAFPLAGVSRRGSYRQQQAPYTAPWAVNCRTIGPGESRRRGGSRPGLAKFCETRLGDQITALIPITYIDSGGTRRHDLVYVADGILGYVRDGTAVATTAELEGPDGVDILDDNGVTIDFSATVANAFLQGVVRGGRAYFADAALSIYNPATGTVEPVVASSGTVPTNEPLIALYRDRIVLAGLTQAYHCSRVGDPTDWAYGDAPEDPAAAVSGQLSDAGLVGDVLTAMIPIHDHALVLATRHTLWVLRGDPRTGKLECLSDGLGIVSRNAWALSPDGLLAFLTNDGVYLWSAGSGQPPVRFSLERLPDELREVDTTANRVSMTYDTQGRGFHLFVTSSSTTPGYHWWIDVENRAFWPMRFVRKHQPLACALMTEQQGLGNAVLASKDGYLRYFLDGQTDDDGLPLESHVQIGPVHLGEAEGDALLAEIHGALEELEDSGSVTWRVVHGRSAAEAAEAALAGLELLLDGQEPTGVSASGEWAEGRNRVQRPRSRGPWVVVWLSSTSSWAYEAITIVARQLGRHR